MTTAAEMFGREKALIGMIHVQALPGCPRNPRDPRDPRKEMGVGEIAEHAVREARLLVEAGFDALLLENMHDVPYLRRRVGPEITAAMTAVGAAVRREVGVPIGIQILAGANREALAVAHAIRAQFIRAEGFVFASIADEGLLEEADAGPLLRYRRAIGAEGVKILADVKKKHSSHAITADVGLAETAKAAEFFGAEGVVVTGVATGEPTSPEEVEIVKETVAVPVLVGSGVRPETAATLLEHADALIVGSWFKKDGLWSNPPDERRALKLVSACRR